MIKIYTTEKDHSILSLQSELTLNNIQSEIIHYSQFTYDKIDINKEDLLILRDPYNTGLDYSEKLRYLLSQYRPQVLFDSEYMCKYPDYEDKLFQSKIFSDLSVAHPTLVDNFDGKDIIAKKRISSRNKGNFIIRTQEEFETFFNQNRRSNYILQKLVEVTNDYRLLFFKGELLGVLEREVKLSNDSANKFNIKGLKAKNTNRSALPLADCSSFINATKADFIGIDIVQSGEEYYFIEANLSPQFDSFSRKTGINVANIIAKEIKTLKHNHESREL
jgi:hypothetical protein